MILKIKSTLVLSFLFFTFVFIRCASVTTTTALIMFTNEALPPTNPVDIEIYKSRLELPSKYVEIGTIKFQGNPSIEEIKKQAAQKGATALILDGNNYILILLDEKMKEESNETKSI